MFLPLEMDKTNKEINNYITNLEVNKEIFFPKHENKQYCIVKVQIHNLNISFLYIKFFLIPYIYQQSTKYFKHFRFR